MKTRRQFLATCSASAAGIALAGAGVGGPQAKLTDGFTSLDQISYALLSAQVNTLFRARLSSGHTVSLRLLEAPLASQTTTNRAPAFDVGHEEFSLIFSGPRENLVPAGIHAFEHYAIGRFEMYLGPVDRSRGGCVLYEAVFNRLRAGTPPPVSNV